MGLFSKKDNELEWLINQIRVDLSNNYKENAKESFLKLEELYDQKKASGKLRKPEKYLGIIEEFKRDIDNFKRTY